MKVVFNDKMRKFKERWTSVENRKRDMKNNFVKYNNIVKVCS